MLEELKKKQQQNQQTNLNDKKTSKVKVSSIIALVGLVITHIVIILAVVLSFRYYAIYPSLFGSIVAIIMCLLIITDIIFFVGFNHKDLLLKTVSCILAVLLLVGGSVGTYFIVKANTVVDNVLDGSSSKYETYSGVFVCYDKKNKFSKLEDLSSKKIGVLAETTNGLSYIAKEILSDTKVDKKKMDYAEVEYKTNAEMIQALIDGEIDAMAITSAYRDIYSLEKDENSPFAKYLNNFIDFYSFEKELKIDSNKKAKNLNTDPFNVLLIGYSRTELGSSVGLADSIILASINPQTYTVSMMSIARDSFVPISCYGGEYDKINSGRSTSRACFIQTVEDFINTGRSEDDHIDIDYYMELDYLGLVAIVNAIGGITINNPVDFELDGIFVPAGDNVFADGQMALQFCRERHHMPNGDFDRQQHQKEVIIQIAKKFINSGDINLALDAMNAASRWMSTDLTLNQLTTVFNLLLNTKNYTSLNTFSLVDFQTLRITGDGGLKYYSYSMRLPLWVYLIYQGSFDESIGHMQEVLGNYSTIKQSKNFEFSSIDLYDRPLFYSLSYANNFMFTPDPMPAYWPSFEGLTVAEAMDLASTNGIKLTVSETIVNGDPRYNPEMEGRVYEQSVRYGALVSEYSSGTITVMGSAELDESKQVPNFVGSSYSKVIEWANRYGVSYDIDFDTSVAGTVGKVVSQSYPAYTPIDDVTVLKIVVKAGKYTISFNNNGHGGLAPSNIDVTTGDSVTTFSSMESSTEGGTKYVFAGWYTAATDGTRVYDTSETSGEDGSTITLYAHWAELYTVTLDAGDGYCSESSVTTADSLPTASKDHYDFDGWYTSGGDKVTDLSTITSNITLYAHYTEANWSEERSADSCSCSAPEGKHTTGCTVTGHGDTEESCDCHFEDDPPTPPAEDPPVTPE